MRKASNILVLLWKWSWPHTVQTSWGLQILLWEWQLCALLCLHNSSGSGDWSVSLSAVLMAIMLCLLGGTVALKFSAYGKGTQTTASSDWIKLFPKAITRRFISNRIGVWCQNVCGSTGVMGAGCQKSRSALCPGCSSGRITFFLWTSELSLIGGVSLSLKKKKDDSINVSRIDGLKEEIRKKGMNEHRV